MIFEDSDKDDVLDLECFSVPIQNIFDMRSGIHPGWGNEWQCVDRQL